MKHYLKKKNILFALALAFAYTTGIVFAAPNDSVSPLIHVGAGDQVVAELRVGSSIDTGAVLDANQTGKNVVFDGIDQFNGNSISASSQYASIFSVIFDGWMQNMIFVGKNGVDFLFTSDNFPSNSSVVSAGTQSSNLLDFWNVDVLPGPSSLVADLQKINIFGNLLSTNFNTTAGNIAGNMQVCVDSNGVLVPCP